jgi:hypothetical protein
MMAMTKEEKIRDDAGKAWAELDSLIMRMKVEEGSAQRELDQLNHKLPKALLEWAKGTASRDAVKAIKARMTELREIINDMPILLKELEHEKRQRCFRPLQNACSLSREREKYNDLKEKICEQPEPALIEDLRRCARDLGEDDECERFLACINPVCRKDRAENN